MEKNLEMTIIKRKHIECVSARELYEKLDVKSHFSDWFKRMCEYGFAEKEDYITLTQKKVTAQGNASEYTDFAVSIDMAKQICMLQRSEQGKRYRQYFIDIEKRYKEQQTLEYKKARQKSIETRNSFTDTLKTHGYDKQHEYIQTSMQMKKPLGITARKKDMTKTEIQKITDAEYLAEAMLSDEYGYHEVNPVCVEASAEIDRILSRKRITA